ncbi:MAG: hypothetical protein GX796_05500 [Clostridiaceae bacterium]|nr:hypothetical protein [Clostridiaceae bacterium]
MSVSIGLLGNDFSLVAGDDRATSADLKTWNDGISKVFQVPFGFVASSGGIAGVKNRFEDRLNNCTIRTRQDIWKHFCYASRDCENFLLSGGIHDKCIATSRFVYSLNCFKDGVLNMEIETLDFMFHTRKLKTQNTLIVNAPKDTKRIRRLKEKYFEQAKTVKDMHEAVYLVACLIDEMAKLTKLISNNVCCGITYKLSDVEAVFLKVSENAKAIKKMYKEKLDLSTIMYVVGGINNAEI